MDEYGCGQLTEKNVAKIMRVACDEICRWPTVFPEPDRLERQCDCCPLFEAIDLAIQEANE